MQEIFVNLSCLNTEYPSIPNTKVGPRPRRFGLDQFHCIFHKLWTHHP